MQGAREVQTTSKAADAYRIALREISALPTHDHHRLTLEEAIRWSFQEQLPIA